MTGLSLSEQNLRKMSSVAIESSYDSCTKSAKSKDKRGIIPVSSNSTNFTDVPSQVQASNSDTESVKESSQVA